MEKNRRKADQVPNRTAVIEKGTSNGKTAFNESSPSSSSSQTDPFLSKVIYKDKVKDEVNGHTQESGDNALE